MTKKRIVQLPEDNIFAFANEQISIKEEKIEKEKNSFEVGKQYSLQNYEFDGLTCNEQNVYELVGIINEINEIPFSSLIMKPIRTNSSMIFSLTKIDCQKLGIEFQQGLQLFPMDMNWICVNSNTNTIEENNNEFDDNDLSTYPVDRDSRTINFMTIRLVGFSQENFEYIRTHEGHLIRTSDFLSSLKIFFKKENEPYENASSVPLKGNINTQIFIKNKRGIIVDNESQSIFIEIDLRYKDLSNNKVFGLKPSFLKNKTINDIIKVQWTEYSLDENDINRLRGYQNIYSGLSVARPKYNLRYSVWN